MRARVADLWVGSTRAAALLNCAPQTVFKVAAAAGVRVRQLPGMHSKQFYRPDLERVVREAEAVPC